MEKSNGRKLILSKETIRVLTDDDLANVAGGAAQIQASYTDGCGLTRLTTLLTYPCCGTRTILTA